jgi:hypothetical protein
MPYPKFIRPKTANDNRHSQFDWSFMHKYLDFWLDRQSIPAKSWNYNRSIHYMYELFNRPWLPSEIRTAELIHWLRREATLNGFKARALTDEDLPYYNPKF